MGRRDIGAPRELRSAKYGFAVRDLARAVSGRYFPAGRIRLGADATAAASGEALTMNSVAHSSLNPDVLRHASTPPLRLRVADVMHRGVLTCSRQTPLSDVAEVMAVRRIHCVVVADEEAEGLWGVVSDLDLVAAACVRELDEQTAGGSAAPPVVTVAPDETVERAAQLITEHATAHLVVVEPDGSRPVGVVSTLDVAAALAGPSRLDWSDSGR
jgi:CBS domain-containing protein